MSDRSNDYKKNTVEMKQKNYSLRGRHTTTYWFVFVGSLVTVPTSYKNITVYHLFDQFIVIKAALKFFFFTDQAYA